MSLLVPVSLKKSMLFPVLAMVLFSLLADVSVGEGEGPTRVFPADTAIPDARLAPLRSLNDKFHPWEPPADREAWEQERESIRRRILVACGLWPLPEKCPLNAVIHGKVDRGDYTVERVFFTSRPGHTVSGNLYRPKQTTGRVPGVLCPHGHWPNGRFYDSGKGADEQLKSGAETYLSGARYPVQARMVQLARMGCVVFHYDMVGYADSQQIEHRGEYNDVNAELWLSNKLGLQTWNSLRALDFLASLKDVDSDRIAVTGASGGGTQTFLLCAIDSRPKTAFPAVMVSTGMQGGCQCENASYLRVGINNVALAATFAPKPMGLTGAKDWTIDIETLGLPELKHIYGLYGHPELVDAKCFPQFPHNYNEVARRRMYDWFNIHLALGLPDPIHQSDFWPLTQEESTVFTESHPRPSDELSGDQLRAQDRALATEVMQQLIPTNTEGLKEYREVIGGAAKIMLAEGISSSEAIEFREVKEEGKTATGLRKGWVSRIGEHQRIPVIELVPDDGAWSGTVLWIDGLGKRSLFDAEGQPVAGVRALLEGGFRVLSADLYLTGEYLNDPKLAVRPVDEKFPGYTFCYNRPLVSERVRDLLAVIAFARSQHPERPLHLVGTGAAGKWVALGRGLVDQPIGRTIVDLQEFRFESVSSAQDPMLLPGALRYGGLPGLMLLAGDGVWETYGCGGELQEPMQQLAKNFSNVGGRLIATPDALTPEIVGKSLTKSP